MAYSSGPMMPDGCTMQAFSPSERAASSTRCEAMALVRLYHPTTRSGA